MKRKLFILVSSIIYTSCIFIIAINVVNYIEQGKPYSLTITLAIYILALLIILAEALGLKYLIRKRTWFKKVLKWLHKINEEMKL